MDHADQIHQLIFDSIRAVQDSLPSADLNSLTSDSLLLESDGGPLDSLGVVTLMVEIESHLEARLSRTVSLAPALAEQPEASPFRSVTTLADYIATCLQTDA